MHLFNGYAIEWINIESIYILWWMHLNSGRWHGNRRHYKIKVLVFDQIILIYIRQLFSSFYSLNHGFSKCGTCTPWGYATSLCLQPAYDTLRAIKWKQIVFYIIDFLKNKILIHTNSGRSFFTLVRQNNIKYTRNK